MSRLSIATFWISALIHGLVVLPLVLTFEARGPDRVYDAGGGGDAFKTEQGITLEGLSFGEAEERVEVSEVAPTVAQSTPPPPVQAVEPELSGVVVSTDSPVMVTTVAEPPPPEVVKSQEVVTTAVEPPPPEPVRPQEVATIDQAAQVETFTEKSAGREQEGGKAEARQQYAGQLNRAMRRVRVGRFTSFGTVTLQFELDRSGKLLSRQVLQSSGNAALDRQALDWLERAAFPALPDPLGDREVFTVPLEFKRAG